MDVSKLPTSGSELWRVLWNNVRATRVCIFYVDTLFSNPSGVFTCVAATPRGQYLRSDENDPSPTKLVTLIARNRSVYGLSDRQVNSTQPR